MRIKNKKRKYTLIAIIFMFSFSLFADWHIEYEDLSAPQKGRTAIFVKGGVVAVSDDQRTLVYFAATDSIIYESKILHAYWEGPGSEFLKILKKSGAKLAGSKISNASIEKTDERERLSGYECERYNVVSDSQTVAVFYRASQISILDSAAMQRFLTLIKLMDFGFDDGFLPPEIFFENGLILKKIIYGKSGNSVDLEAVAVDTVDLDPAIFAPSPTFNLLTAEEILSAEKMQEGN